MDESYKYLLERAEEYFDRMRRDRKPIYAHDLGEYLGITQYDANQLLMKLFTYGKIKALPTPDL